MPLRMYYNFFKKSFAFCIQLGKYDFSLAVEYCLISNKGLDKRKKKVFKNISVILIYCHDLYLH